MDPNPNPNPQKTPQTGDQPTRETKPEQRPLTDNERQRGPEQNEKARQSNLAGDQDVDDADETDDNGR